MRFRAGRVLAGLCALWWSWQAAASETVVISSGEWAPFVSQSAPQYGFASDVVRRAFARAGVEAEFRYYPWERSRMLVEEGRVVASLAWADLPSRRAWALFSSPLFSDRVMLYMRAPLYDLLRDAVSLRRRTVLLPDGYDPGILAGMLDKDQITLLRVRDAEEGFKMLSAGRGDAMPLSEAVGQLFLRRHAGDAIGRSLRVRPVPMPEPSYSLMFSRKHPDGARMYELFERGFAELRASGEYARMQQAFARGAYAVHL